MNRTFVSSYDTCSKDTWGVKCKTQGGKVEHFDCDQWKLQAKEIMMQGLVLIFSQNKLCVWALQETGTTSLVEAVPYDKLIGCQTESQEQTTMEEKELDWWSPWRGSFGAYWIGSTKSQLLKGIIAVTLSHRHLF